MPGLDGSDADRAAAIAALRDRIIDQGIRGTPFDQVLEGMSEALVAQGIPLMRLFTGFRALHPTHGAFSHSWQNDIGRQSEAFANNITDQWRASPLYHMLAQNLDSFRACPGDAAHRARFPILQDFHDQGGTDYVARRIAFTAPEGMAGYDPDDPPEGMIVSAVAHGPGGFSDRDLADLEHLLPALSLTLKTSADRQMTRDLLAAYLGADAGARVLSGEITRGSSQKIGAVILMFDLAGFTQLSERLPGQAIIDMLNAAFAPTVERIEAHGGNVLKFMGDGLLAVFAQDNEQRAGARALACVQEIRAEIDALNSERDAAGLPVTGCTMALHAGNVLYGNIGGANRLDFTVIGPAVNTAARLLDMCARVDRTIVVSDALARPHLADVPALVSLGQYRLRGVDSRHELFTLD